MPETPEDRSKRVFLNHLDNSAWSYQISFFFNNYSDCKNALEHFQSIRSRLARSFKKNPFLWRLCLKKVNADLFEDLDGSTPRVTAPYMTLITDKKISVNEVEPALSAVLAELDLKILYRSFPKYKQESYRRAVSNQKPHKLNEFFNGKKVNRFGQLNIKAQEG